MLPVDFFGFIWRSATAISGLLSALGERERLNPLLHLQSPTPDPPPQVSPSSSSTSSPAPSGVDKIGNVPGLALPFIAICFAICHLQLTIFLQFSQFSKFFLLTFQLTVRRRRRLLLTLTKKRHLQIGQRQLSLGSCELRRRKLPQPGSCPRSPATPQRRSAAEPAAESVA